LDLQEFLSVYYHIQAEEKITLDGRTGWKNNQYAYFTIYGSNMEMIRMEQAVLSYFLKEAYQQMAVPVSNIQGQLITAFEGEHYLVMEVAAVRTWETELTDGTLLAEFHQLGTMYQYEPKRISSYGQWKDLWTQKLNLFEHKIQEEAQRSTSAYYRLLMDVLPYIIGISENAIQYLRESEADQRYHEVDQGSLAFRRYHKQLKSVVLWPEELVYDHPARDIAERIRFMLIQGEKKAKIYEFLQDYNSIRPLSVFSWRLIYARLIFPIHLFDAMESGLQNENAKEYDHNLEMLLKNQKLYENRLGHFFQIADVDNELLHIPVLHWL